MKKHLLLLFLLIITVVSAQHKFLDRDGTISFEASEASFEPVKAKNNSVTAIINTRTGEFASLALMKEFHFRNALMQEHFNENYIESDNYPKATFKGSISNFNFINLTEEEYAFKISGTLTLHGEAKKISTKLLISSTNGVINLKGGFIIAPHDFNISIPKIVRNKIAKQVKVEFNFKLKPE